MSEQPLAISQLNDFILLQITSGMEGKTLKIFGIEVAHGIWMLWQHIR